MSVLDRIIADLSDQILLNESPVLLKLPCSSCGSIKKISVTTTQLRSYKYGELIQRAFPHLSADDREMLISGTCGDCFDEMFKDMEMNDEN